MKKILKMQMILVLVLLFITNASPAFAKTITGKLSISACKSGKYLYYSYNGGGTRDGIIRLNTKTGKKTTIIRNSMQDSSWTNGYRNLVVKGKYIYAVWDKFAGTGSSLLYIYRISKDGKTMQKLGCGNDIVIVGNRIYYTKMKFVKDEYGGYTEEVGKASMKLNGKDKRSEKETNFLWKSASCEIYNPIEDEIVSKISEGGYTYFSAKDGKKLLRKNNKSGKLKTIFKTTGKYQLSAIQVYDNMILVDCTNDSFFKKRLYYVSNTGKGKKKLKEWMQAE